MFQPAINSRGIVVLAANEEKDQDQYTCIECGKEMILKKGEKKKPHFAHKNIGNCKGESIEHKAAKLKFKQLLEDGIAIEVQLSCVQKHTLQRHWLLLVDGLSVVMEKQFTYQEKKLVPDLALIDKKGDLCIAIEIYQTHRQSGRPEPWYEFRAPDVLNMDIQNPKLVDCRLDRRCPTCGPCHGSCYEQSPLDENVFIPKYKCVEGCVLHLCEHCQKSYPQYLTGHGKGGECWTCETRRCLDKTYVSSKKRCAGSCWIQNTCEAPTEYVRERDCGKNCVLIPCKKCGNPTPEEKMPFDGHACPDCRYYYITGESPPRKRISRKTVPRQEKTKERAFCGVCRKVGVKKYYKNCNHYSCLACYNQASANTKCAYCKQRIK